MRYVCFYGVFFFFFDAHPFYVAPLQHHSPYDFFFYLFIFFFICFFVSLYSILSPMVLRRGSCNPKGVNIL